MSSILPGSRFGPYEVKGVLGSGGMAKCIWRATSTSAARSP
jgi:hypothetical protein